MSTEREPDRPVQETGLVGRLLRLAVIDVEPLRRHRDFRLLWSGQLVSMFGGMITMVAVPFQIFRLTHSSFAVGLLGLVQIIPILGLAFVGGALADARDRRQMVQVTELVLAVVSFSLLVNALVPSPSLLLIYLAAGIAAGLDALQRPSLDAMLPRLVERGEITAAGALSTLRVTVGMVAGPAIGGLLIAAFGLPSTYAIDVCTFVFSLVALSLMRAVPPPPDAERPSVRRVIEGLAYARSRPELLGTYLVDMAAMFFGMPMALFPAIAASLGGPAVLGALFTAPAVGSLLATLTCGWSSHVHRHGLAVILAAACWGAAIVGFGLSPSLPVALLCLAVAGGADTVSGLFRSAIWNGTIPDALRGRLAGIELLSYSTGPAFGDLEAGTVATVFSIRTSVVSGGLLCVVSTVLLAFLLPGFRRYDAGTSAGEELMTGVRE